MLLPNLSSHHRQEPWSVLPLSTRRSGSPERTSHQRWLDESTCEFSMNEQGSPGETSLREGTSVHAVQSAIPIRKNSGHRIQGTRCSLKDCSTNHEWSLSDLQSLPSFGGPSRFPTRLTIQWNLVKDSNSLAQPRWPADRALSVPAREAVGEVF